MEQENVTKRGRPATGKALTPAERKRVQRERDRGLFATTTGGIEALTTSGLIERLHHHVGSGHDALVKEITAELLRRTVANKEKP